MPVSGYRADIDGLRAIAVGMVVLFHANLGIPGGFIGVDIFFVISGFLITGLVQKALMAGTFQLAEFWTRRLRRLLPAACLMTLTTLIFGSWLLSPADYEELGKSAIAQPLMVANFFFWKKTGYFDGPADLKPLLHTWSLAVEEQFYLVYPIILMGLAGRSQKTVLWTLGCLCGVSFFISLWGMSYAPSAIFFLLPGRIWEMVAGGMIGFLPVTTRWKPWMLNFIAGVGLGLILISAFLYTPALPFPGLTAVPPCLGTLLLIYANTDVRSTIGRWLSHKWLTGLGLISYSLYLWHWPVIVYLQYRLGDDLTLAYRWLAIGTSVFLAWVSWRWVEMPFRQGVSWQNRQKVLAYAGFATAVIVACGWTIRAGDGWPSRFSPELQQVFATMKAPKYHRIVPLADMDSNSVPQFGNTSAELDCLIWGDSHAMTLVPCFENACEELGIHGYQATHPGTLPFIDYNNERKWAAPEEYGREVLELIQEEDIEVVILAGYWSRDSDQPKFAAALRKTVQTLLDHDVNVVIVRDVPTQANDERSLVAAPMRRSGNLEDFGITLAAHRSHQQSADAAIATLLPSSGITIIDPVSQLVDDSGRCPIVIDGQCLYSDQHHLSVAGSMRLKPLFSNLLHSLIPRVKLAGHVVAP